MAASGGADSFQTSLCFELVYLQVLRVLKYREFYKMIR